MVVVAVLLVVALAGCDLRTTGAPKGGLTLTVVLEDAQHLVPGHAVRVADVTVGTVMRVELEGYAARVTLSIEEGRAIPEGTRVTLSQTSLLGENYIRLEYPTGFDPATDPTLGEGAELAADRADPTLEQVTADALEVLGAVEGGDLARIVEALATGAGGRGELLNRAIEQLAAVGASFADQRASLGTAVDGLASLGAALAVDDASAVDAVIGDLALATDTLARQRERFVDTLGRITDLAVVLDEDVLEPHAAELDQMLSQLDDVAAVLAANRGTVGDLLHNLAVLSERAPRAGDGVGGILIYAWITSLALPGGVEVPLAPAEASAAPAVSMLAPPGAGEDPP